MNALEIKVHSLHNESDALSGDSDGKVRDNLSSDIDNNKVDVQEGDAEHITDDSSRMGRMDMVRHPVRQATLTAKKIKEWLNPTGSLICVGSVAITIANNNIC